MHLQHVSAHLLAGVLLLCSIAQAMPVPENFSNALKRVLGTTTFRTEPTAEVTENIYTLLSHFHLPIEQLKFSPHSLSRRSAGHAIQCTSTDSLVAGCNPLIKEVESLFHALVKRGMDLNTAVERAMPALEEGGWEAFVRSVKEGMGE